MLVAVSLQRIKFVLLEVPAGHPLLRRPLPSAEYGVLFGVRVRRVLHECGPGGDADWKLAQELEPVLDIAKEVPVLEDDVLLRVAVRQVDVAEVAQPHAVEEEHIKAGEKKQALGSAALVDLAKARHQVTEQPCERVKFSWRQVRHRGGRLREIRGQTTEDREQSLFAFCPLS